MRSTDKQPQAAAPAPAEIVPTQPRVLDVAELAFATGGGIAIGGRTGVVVTGRAGVLLGD